MGIFRNFGRLRQFVFGSSALRIDDPHCTARDLRICSYEHLEDRKVMAADIHLGAVYYEPATGDDSAPNVIQVTFQGGVPGTQLTQIIIDGDKNHDGKYSSGEIFFDTAAGGVGEFKSAPFKVVSSDGFQVVGWTVVDGGQKLVINLSGFDAGETLKFSLDVDEVQYVDPDTGDVDVNSLVEGNEFQRSILTGTFEAPHYYSVTGSAIFWDAYDKNFSDANIATGTTLDLPKDSYSPPSSSDQSDLTAGAVLSLKQEPLPITIAGTVYHDRNKNNAQNNGEEGIANVSLSLYQWNGSQWIATGKTVKTDAQGNYKFTGVVPGTYRVSETQPSGWMSVGSQPGTVDGVVDGVSIDADNLGNIALLGGQDGVRYNFGEILPASLSGKVWSDTNNDCVYQPTDLPLSGVKIDLLDAQGNVIESTFTDAQGNYQFQNLMPGTYGVFEHQPAGYLQGMDMLGTVGGVIVGTHGGTDKLTQIVLGSGAEGIHYDFCEILPASLSGKVWSDTDGDCVYSPVDVPLKGIKIDLLDDHGNVVATTTTDAQGNYAFQNLTPGTYSVFEHQPAGYLQGMEMLGTVDGIVVGAHGGTDLLTQITLAPGKNGIHYDFCEILPATLSGRVWSDTDGDCVYSPVDVPLSGIKIDLLDKNGNVVESTFTDAQGNYSFTNLTPGTYSVFEHQPAGYLQGMDMLGTVDGIIVGTHGGTDLLSQIILGPGKNGIHYDFCEILPAGLSGKVWSDKDGDCVYTPVDKPLSGVKIDLLDDHGNVIQSTFTDAQGNYSFTNLTPGTYSVFEHQPSGYLQGMDMLGTVGGVVVGVHGGTDLLSQITLGPGKSGIHYDFCEILPASLSGKVWNDKDGDCVYTTVDAPLAGVKIDLLDSQGNVIKSTFTDAQGNYSFTNLTPGTYSVFEHQPVGFLEGMDMLGTVGGITVGTHGGKNLLSQIVLGPGSDGIHYDFCEILPASLSGKVYADPEGDCIFGPNDTPLAGVKIELLDATGKVIATTTTNANGNYKFDNLTPGEYRVRETQPAGYYQGGQVVGTVNGVVVGVVGGIDLLSQIKLNPGDNGIRYDFCELLPNSISGYVHLDPEGDCATGPKDTPIAGVKIDLLDSRGNVIASTRTDSNGFYKFDNLAPGTYGIFEHQPSKYYDEGEHVGSRGGVISANDTITQIVLLSNDNGTHYDFCEIPGGKISGYVFQDGPGIEEVPGQPRPNPEDVRDGKRTPDDRPIAGVKILLYDSSGNPILDASGKQRSTITDSKGYYEFTHLPVGKYLVREIQPDNYVDSLDTPGTTGGVAANHKTPTGAIPNLPFDHKYDVIEYISLGVGGHSRENNFSEVVYVTTPIIPPIELVQPQIPPLYTPTGTPPIFPELDLPQPYKQIPRINLDGSDGVGYTWHLSIVDAGFPRGPIPQSVAMNLVSINSVAWSRMSVSRGLWLLQDAGGEIIRRETIGIKDAIPVAGDFNGDGVMELGLYLDGEWFVDLNNNGKWDAADLWAKLGTRDDKPVTGDWDGDGKDDIGIYGPAWARDPIAVKADPGLPDPLNNITGKQKNTPPVEDEAALGKRKLQRGASGQMREDLIDHVFHYGTPIDHPVAGDWTGNGLRRIGIFYNGEWHLDIDGDGRFEPSDRTATFGQSGDLPVVGDWNGEGIERLGVFRGGDFILDTNGNNIIDGQDKVIHLGKPGDKPVVGDWNGDGRDEVGVYQDVEAGTPSDTVAEAAVEAPEETITK